MNVNVFEITTLAVALFSAAIYIWWNMGFRSRVRVTRGGDVVLEYKDGLGAEWRRAGYDTNSEYDFRFVFHGTRYHGYSGPKGLGLGGRHTYRLGGYAYKTIADARAAQRVLHARCREIDEMKAAEKRRNAERRRQATRT